MIGYGKEGDLTQGFNETGNDRFSLQITAKAVEEHRVHSTTHMWICCLLGNRNIISSGENHEKALNNKVSEWRRPVTSAVDPGC
jgi:hypothetical protein